MTKPSDVEPDAPVAVPHAHVSGPAGAVPRSVRRALLVAVAPFLLAALVGLVLLWPRSTPRASDFLGPPAVLLDGTVVDKEAKPCLPGGPVTGECVAVVVRLSEGRDAGELVSLDLNEGPGAPTLRAGDRIVVGRSDDAPEGPAYYFADHQRRTPLLVLAGLFAVVVVLLGRRRGLAALAALGISLLVVVRFVLPAVLDGRNPLAVAVVGSAVIMFLALYLTHGFTSQTSTAVLGTLVSLALTAVLAAVFVGVSRFTGLGSEEAGFLQAAAGQVDVRGLLLGGIVIGSLGVLDDVTVTQVSAVWQLHAANPEAGPRQLYGSALEIGRDHVASTVNTLVLAYAGASLPLLVLFSLSNQQFGNVVTGEVVATEVVRTLVGSIGLVASVPITTALAAVVVTRREHRPARGREPGGDAHGDAEADLGADEGAALEPWLQPSPEPPAPARRSRPGRLGGLRRRQPPGAPDAAPGPDWTAPRAEREFWGDDER